MTWPGEIKNPDMATSIKPVLRLDKMKADGKAPLFIRITTNRRTSYRSIGISLDPKHWDASSGRIKNGHPNSARANHKLAQCLAELNNAVYEHEIAKTPFTPSQVFTNLETPPSPPQLLEFCEQVIRRMEHANAFGTVNRMKTAVNKLRRFLRGKDVPMADVNVKWLRRYEDFLRVKCENQTNTVASNMKLLRKVLNEALAEDLIERSPFKRYSIKHANTHPEYLTEDELSALQALDLPAGSVLERHRDLYVFACYAGGIRVGDLLRLEWRNFDGERIKLVTMKTKDALSIKLSRTALDIIEKLPPASSPQDFLFGLMPNDLDRNSAYHMHKAVSGTTAHINKNLKILAERARIDKRVTFHTSRHTWATRALRKGMPIQYVSKLLGHSSIRMTEHYVKIVNLDLDQAMDVFD